MTKYSPSLGDKKEALRRLSYEINQLLESANELQEIDSKNYNQVVKNALLESHLLHIRNLLDFFEHPERKKDDVIAIDYEFVVRKVEIDPKYRRRLNKDLAHLTYDRVNRETQEEKGWPIKQVAMPILSRIEEFIDHLLFEYPEKDNLGIEQEQWKKLVRTINSARESWTGEIRTSFNFDLND